MSAATSHPRLDLSNLSLTGKRMLRSLPRPRATTSWLIILGALIAFEIFNFSTTEFALADLLGGLSFAGWRWATILAVAFCAMDFAGIARIFSNPSQQEPAELWYLIGAWLLAATMNAILTWWAVSLALLEHGALGNEILARDTLIRSVPVFVAALVWLLRILLIGTFSLSMNTQRNPSQRAIVGSPHRNRSRAKDSDGTGSTGNSKSRAKSRQPIRPAPKPSSGDGHSPQNRPAMARAESLQQ